MVVLSQIVGEFLFFPLFQGLSDICFEYLKRERRRERNSVVVFIMTNLVRVTILAAYVSV